MMYQIIYYQKILFIDLMVQVLYYIQMNQMKVMKMMMHHSIQLHLILILETLLVKKEF